MSIKLLDLDPEFATPYNGRVTLQQAQRVLAAVDKGLTSGVGQPIPGQMCVEAAVCFAFGEGHDDEPLCVNREVRNWKISLNDAAGWSGKKARAKGLRRIAIAQLGSIECPPFQPQVFASAVEPGLFRYFMPSMLFALARDPDITRAEAIKLRDLARLTGASASDRIVKRCIATLGRITEVHAMECDNGWAQVGDLLDCFGCGGLSDAEEIWLDTCTYIRTFPKIDDKRLTAIAEIGVHALRKAKSPGVKLMDQLCPL